MAGGVSPARDMSPTPILDRVEAYRGTIVDLDAGAAWTARDLASARAALTRGLKESGLNPGDRCALAISNGPLFIVALASLLECGASPLLVHFKTPAGELRRTAERFGLGSMLAEPDDAPARDSVAAAPQFFTLAHDSMLELRRFALPDERRAPASPIGAPLHPSSGSTGLPKVAIRPGFAAIAEARHYAETMSIGAGDKILALPPMSHAYGYGMSVMLPLLTGADIVTLRAFTGDAFWRAIDAHRPSVLPLTPAMLDGLSMGKPRQLDCARWTLSAGATLTRPAFERFRKQTGAVARPLYGTTETGGIAVGIGPDETYLDGRVGPPMRGVDIETRAVEDGGTLGAEKLFVRSSSMMAGYLDGLDGRIDPLDRDGWFATGDLARLEADGIIHLRGRDSEVINLAGLKVVPVEVEEAIAELPGVIEVKVYGGAHAFGHAIVKAAVALEAGVSEAQLRAHCATRLVYYKRPHTIEIVERLPRTPAGKIDRARLP